MAMAAAAVRGGRGIQLQFAADFFCMMMTIPSLFLSRTSKNFFFCQDDEDDEGYFGSSLTFVGQILFCYARFVLSFAKISSLQGEGLLEKKHTDINEHVKQMSGNFQKDTVTQLLQKKRA